MGADGLGRTVRGERGNPEPSYGERSVLLISKIFEKIIIFVLILSYFTSSCKV